MSISARKPRAICGTEFKMPDGAVHMCLASPLPGEPACAKHQPSIHTELRRVIALLEDIKTRLAKLEERAEAQDNYGR